ncbi:Hypothetical predicted protein [Pelobates cultripes]|uniref:Uncharacterized protein n=1 Tax=Pelobates cultripes TaxID=61616 RepID=A0AAD1TL87_PELCU|nr:Hypothetical predicted protein [Pelobates cultripes]
MQLVTSILSATKGTDLRPPSILHTGKVHHSFWFGRSKMRARQPRLVGGDGERYTSDNRGDHMMHLHQSPLTTNELHDGNKRE